MGNMMYNMMTATHAFEIYADGQLVFSKLDTGRLPMLEEFFDGLAAALGKQSVSAAYTRRQQPRIPGH